MKTVDKHELYTNLRGFLKSKGVALEDGSYARRVEQGCHVLAGVINTSQDAVARAKVEVDKTMDHLRQSIHEATAPKAAPRKASPAAAKAAPKAKSTKAKTKGK